MAGPPLRQRWDIGRETAHWPGTPTRGATVEVPQVMMADHNKANGMQYRCGAGSKWRDAASASSGGSKEVNRVFAVRQRVERSGAPRSLHAISEVVSRPRPPRCRDMLGRLCMQQACTFRWDAGRAPPLERCGPCLGGGPPHAAVGRCAAGCFRPEGRWGNFSGCMLSGADTRRGLPCFVRIASGNVSSHTHPTSLRALCTR